MFLTTFGLGRERDELRRWVAEAVVAAGPQERGVLTQAEYLRESGLGEDEYRKGDLRAAYARFTKLLARVEALPEGTPLGRGSYEHCLILDWLAECLRGGGQAAAAEIRRRESLAVIDVLIGQQPGDQNFIHQRGVLLTGLGDVLRDQGKYSQARVAYDERLKIAKQQGNLRGQATALGQLGILAEKLKDSTEARLRFMEAREVFHALGEPAMEAVAWYNLGRVAQEQEELAEAERYYRESLVIYEQLGDALDAAKTCNQLANVANAAGRPTEAEGWYRRALELDERVHPGSFWHANHFNNLAYLLINEVQAGRAPKERLAEARNYAERALAIKETLDASSGIWNTLSILADIADLEGWTEEARNYRRSEREAYAAFEGNRYHIDQQHGQLIVAIAAAAKGDVQAREAVEEGLPRLEENGWHITAAAQRIWAGERDWHSLTENMGRQEALLVLRVLETIEQPVEVQDEAPEEIIASLPAAVREALEQGDQAAFDRALEALSPEERQAVMKAMSYLQEPQEEEREEAEEVVDVVKQFEPLLQAIVSVAVGAEGAALRSKIEADLSTLEAKGWHLREAVERIWMGERDAALLTEGLDEEDSGLVQRILEIIAEGRK